MTLRNTNTTSEQREGLLKLNKFLTVIKWAIEILTAIYILFILWAVQPTWHAKEGFRRTIVDTFLNHFPFNDVQLTWIMMVVFATLIGIKILLLKNTNFYQSPGKFFMDLASMLLWKVSFSWLLQICYFGLRLVWHS